MSFSAQTPDRKHRLRPQRLTPLDLLIALLVQPERQSDGVAADIEAARRRE